ncbi:MAG: MBL fold metallo-hydrolase [Actinomycetota bacterium]|nr:MBL fold metallo-hydrolase [Actinomycetota bacterium]
MKQHADGVWQLAGFPPNAINVFLLDDVLVDASTRFNARKILKELEGRPLSAHALTHAHPDHQGASHAVCERFGVPFWVGEQDVAAAENPKLIGERQPDHFMAQLFAKTMTGPAHHVDRHLREGDDVASFKVIDTPGHSAGHVAFWRESDRVLVLGDVLNSADVYTLIPGLRTPKDYFTPDPAENRRSARKLALLEPKLVLFGHGPPVTDTKKFVDFVNGLPD